MADPKDKSGKKQRPVDREPVADDAGDSEFSLAQQISMNPAMARRYRAAMARRRAESGGAAADGPTSEQPQLSPEQQAQAETEYKLLQQQKAQQHKAREAIVDRLNATWAAQHGFDYKTDDQQVASFWRELKGALVQSFMTNPKLIRRDFVAWMHRRAARMQSVMDDAKERGVPMTPMGADLAAGFTDSLEDIRGNIEACEIDLAKAAMAESATDQRMAVLSASLNMGKAALGAYAIAEPLASVTEGGISTIGGMGGGAKLATADARTGASASTRVAAGDGAATSESTIHQASKVDGHIEDGLSGGAEGGAKVEAADGAVGKAQIKDGQYVVEPGASPSPGERAAAKHWLDQGKKVTARRPVGETGVQGVRTADLEVEGVGRVDVMEPAASTDADNLVRGILKKSDQAATIQVELPSGSTVTPAEMARIPNRVFGHPKAGKAITRIVIRQDGSVIIDTTRR